MTAQPITAEASVPGGPVASKPLLVIASSVTIGFAALCWAFFAFWIAVSTESSAWMLFSPLAALPAVIAGSVLAWRKGEWLPFYLGTAITLLIPVFLIVLTLIVDPAPGPFANGMD